MRKIAVGGGGGGGDVVPKVGSGLLASSWQNMVVVTVFAVLPTAQSALLPVCRVVRFL